MDGSFDAFESSLDMGATVLLAAGPGERRDTLAARAYTHPALTGRVVVRLATEPLGPAEDLVLGFLGFDPPARPPVPVGVARRQARGFPAWVLVHDPAAKQHALNLVKDIERFSLLASTKPGYAKDLFERAAGDLAANLPHFLPAYCEQAARAFLAVENTAFAAVMFGKAREAERAHGLDVDEELLSDTYVEFALAGAVTAKALSAYAKALSARTAPDEAYRRFRRVCVERIAGGLAPYAAMQPDLRRLAKAAKLDQSAAEQDLVRDLLPLAALARAQQQFWDDYRAPLIALARAEPAIRGWLLDHLPVVADVGVFEAEAFWLGVVEESGAVAGLTEPVDTLAPEVLPARGAAEWLTEFTSRPGEPHRYPAGWPKPELVDLVRRMAPRLRAEGVPLRAAERECPSIDLLDHYLSAAIPVADPGPGFRFRSGALSAGRAEARSDLVALAADPRFQPMLRTAVDQAMAGRLIGPEKLPDAPGLRTFIAGWLGRVARELAEGGLADAKRLLGVVGFLADQGAAPALRGIDPAAWAAVAAFDPGARLAESLRHGIPDELGWPLLDEVCDASAARFPGIRLELTEQWPYLIVGDSATFTVLGPGSVVHRQDRPQRQTGHRSRRTRPRWTEGRLSVTVQHKHERPEVFWSGSPCTALEPAAEPLRAEEVAPGSVELPDGARSFGGRPYRAGDADCDQVGPVATDGQRYWVLAYSTGPKPDGAAAGGTTTSCGWHEFDPLTGAVGAPGTPGFFAGPAAAQAPGERLLEAACHLLPLPPGTEGSPLGQAEGVTGWRTTTDATGRQTGTGVDGRTVRYRPLPQADADAGVPSPVLIGAIRFPGAAEDLAIVCFGSPLAADPGYVALVTGQGRSVARFRIGETRPVHVRGTSCVVPWRYWHFMTPRDLAGSAALREFTAEAARDLLSGAERMDFEGIVTAVGRHVPQITDERLRRGVAGFVQNAADCAGIVAKLTDAAAPADSPAPSPEPGVSP